MERVTGHEQAQLIGSVDAPPVETEPQHQLEDQVQCVIWHPQTFCGVRSQPHTREDRLDRIGGAEVDPVLFGLCRAPGYAARVIEVAAGQFGGPRVWQLKSA